MLVLFLLSILFARVDHWFSGKETVKDHHPQHHQVTADRHSTVPIFLEGHQSGQRSDGDRAIWFFPEDSGFFLTSKFSCVRVKDEIIATSI